MRCCTTSPSLTRGARYLSGSRFGSGGQVLWNTLSASASVVRRFAMRRASAFSRTVALDTAAASDQPLENHILRRNSAARLWLLPPPTVIGCGANGANVADSTFSRLWVKLALALNLIDNGFPLHHTRLQAVTLPATGTRSRTKKMAESPLPSS